MMVIAMDDLYVVLMVPPSRGLVLLEGFRVVLLIETIQVPSRTVMLRWCLPEKKRGFLTCDGVMMMMRGFLTCEWCGWSRRTKELNNGRLAMIACLGMWVEELLGKVQEIV
jgi:hypothetical protein